MITEKIKDIVGPIRLGNITDVRVVSEDRATIHIQTNAWRFDFLLNGRYVHDPLNFTPTLVGARLILTEGPPEHIGTEWGVPSDSKSVKKFREFLDTCVNDMLNNTN